MSWFGQVQAKVEAVSVLDEMAGFRHEKRIGIMQGRNHRTMPLG